jgi:hypothetical protein
VPSRRKSALSPHGVMIRSWPARRLHKGRSGWRRKRRRLQSRFPLQTGAYKGPGGPRVSARSRNCCAPTRAGNPHLLDLASGYLSGETPSLDRSTNSCDRAGSPLPWRANSFDRIGIPIGILPRSSQPWLGTRGLDSDARLCSLAAPCSSQKHSRRQGPEECQLFGT